METDLSTLVPDRGERWETLQDTGPGDSAIHIRTFPLEVAISTNYYSCPTTNNWTASSQPALGFKVHGPGISALRGRMRSGHSLLQLGLPGRPSPLPAPGRGPWPQASELPWHGFKAGAKGCAVSRAGDTAHVIPARQGLAPPATAPSVPAAAPRAATAAGRRGQGGKAALSTWRAGAVHSRAGSGNSGGSGPAVWGLHPALRSPGLRFPSSPLEPLPDPALPAWQAQAPAEPSVCPSVRAAEPAAAGPHLP